MAAGIYDSRNTSHNWPAPNGTTPNGIGASGAKFSTSSDPSLRQRYQPYDSSTSSTSIPRQGSGSSLGLSAPAYDTRGNSLTSSPPHNNVEMTRDMLIQVLEYFSTIVPAYFDNRPVRLVIHGGACMLLHPRLYPLTQSPPMSQSLFVGDDKMPIPIPAKRTATRDVDYINRSFAAEWKSVGVVDATERLKKCIRATARRFGLGADWMNSDADIALPMATK